MFPSGLSKNNFFRPSRRWMLLLASLFFAFSFGGCASPASPSRPLPPSPSAPPTRPLPPTLESPKSPSPSPKNPLPTPEKKSPPDIFGKMTEEQADCLRSHWSETAFQEITTYQRPPTQEEAPALQECELLKTPSDKNAENKNDELGPRGHQIMSATSEDGLNWVVNEDVLWNAGSVPDVVRLPDGEMLIYFVDGLSPAPGLLQGSPETGWTQIEMSIEGGPREGIVDPDVMLLPDGRVRLFYLAAFAPDPAAPRSVYSAISEDGIHFVQEEGERIAVELVTDPSVIQLPDGSWLMALSQGGRTLLAASEDGKTFSLTGVSIELGGVPELALLPEGDIRLFVSTRDGIRSLRSPDNGKTWKQEEGVRIPAEERNVAADPSVVHLPDGSWYMVWKRLNPEYLSSEP